MENQELINKATAHVIDAMLGKTGEPWEGSHPVHEGISGWCGIMSPLNRPAFVGKFGEDFTRSIEQAAKAELARRADFWERSQGKKHTDEASEKSLLPPSKLQAGDFIFGRMMHLKCEGDFHATLDNCIKWPKCLGEKQLYKIERVIECEDVSADKIEHRAEGNEGGSASDDMTDELMERFEHNFHKLPQEYRDTYYTLCALVRDKHERYYLADFEGYGMVRYVVVPVSWETMFKPVLDEIRAERERRAQAEAEAKAKEEAAARAAYDARCAKWEKLMTPVAPQQRGVDTATGKKNVLAMAKAAFPWVRFSVRYSRSWGHGYILKWTNGPTVEEMKAATDFGLFKPSEDTFDGMTDSSDVKYARFTDFADKFGGVCNGVEFDRQTAAHDRNRDPNAPERSEPSAPVAGEAEVRENPAKHGVEIRFPSMPSEEIRAEIRSHGFRWSKFAKVWYNQATDENRAVAAEAVAKFNAGKEAA